jgi:hypothetical protein
MPQDIGDTLPTRMSAWQISTLGYVCGRSCSPNELNLSTEIGVTPRRHGRVAGQHKEEAHDQA